MVSCDSEMGYNERYIHFTEIETTQDANSGFVSPGIACFHIGASEAWGLEWAGWCCAPGAAAAVPCRGSAIPAAIPVPRVLSGSSGAEQHHLGIKGERN